MRFTHGIYKTILIVRTSCCVFFPPKTINVCKESMRASFFFKICLEMRFKYRVAGFQNDVRNKGSKR